MLYALREPLSLLVLALSFVVVVTVLGTVGAVLADRAGAPEVRAEGRRRPDPRAHLDPFGTVAAVLSGLGWAKPLPVRGRSRAGLVAAVVTGPLLLLATGLGLMAAFGVVVGAPVESTALLLQRGVGGFEVGERVLLLTGTAFAWGGLLALVPLPPLPGGRLLLALAPRTRGWQQAAYQLDERNFGVLALLVLLVLPISAGQALLPYLLDTLLGPLTLLVTGG